jgi:type I restriction enzyme S subunit
VKPGYKQTEVGVIPEEWEVEAVGDAFEIRNQLRLPLSQTVRERMVGSYPYYGPTSVQGWINEYRVEGEHALIGEDGDHFLKWRDQAMTLLVTGKFNVNNHAHIVKGTKNLTSWFFWFFANRDISSYLTRQGAGRYKLTKATLLTLPCPVPPLPEQRAIATALSDVDGLLGGLDRLIAKKRDLKQAAMQQLLTGQTRLPGFHGEWEVKRLGEVAMLKNGYAFKSDTYTSLGTFKIITIASVQDGYMLTDACNTIADEPTDLQPHQRLRRGDILISMTGNVGRVCRVNENHCLLNQRVGKLVPVGVVDALLFVLLGQPSFISAMTGVAKGGAQPNLSASDITEHTFNIPKDEAEQTAIAEVLSEMDGELAVLEQRREKTRALKQAMMQELLTGRTRLV